LGIIPSILKGSHFGSTVISIDCVTLPFWAVIVVLPWAIPVMSPLEPSVLPAVAMSGLPELQVSRPVTSAFELSTKVPSARNWTFS
jgi:hypothetical protein